MRLEADCHGQINILSKPTEILIWFVLKSLHLQHDKIQPYRLSDQPNEY